MFERLGSWTYRFRFLIVLAWIVIGAFFATFAPSISGEGSTDQTSFLPSDAPSVGARNAIERAFPGSTSSSSATITMDRPSGLTDADRRWRDKFAAWVGSDAAPEKLRAAVAETETADSRPELEELLRAEDGTFELFVINLDVADAGDEAKAVVEELRAHLEATTPEGLETHVTGAAAISSDYLEAVQVGTDNTTMVTIILVVVVLLLIYRAPLAALIPLITIGAAFVTSKGVLGFLAAAGWQVSSTLETFLVVMVFGVGTDYAIFLISRYREEVSHDGDWHDAARTTVRRIGAVITASAGTVIVGMLAMGVGDFRMITSMGPGIAIAIAVTLLAALTLSPALLSIFGHYLFWPLHTREKREGEPRGFFASLAGAVTRRPLAVTVGLTAVLLVPILYLPQVDSNFDVLADLPRDADSRIGYQQIGDHLGEDKLVQSTGLIALGADGDVLAPDNLAALHALMVSLHESGGIATTTSLVTPEGDTVVPDGFRPSATLEEIGRGFEGDGGAQDADTASLLDPEVRDGLDQALDYVNGLGVAFPDVAAAAQLRETRAGLEHALDIVDRVSTQSVLATQLRTLSSSITDPTSASTGGGTDDDSTLMSDYLAELAVAYPEVRSLDAWRDGVAAARELEAEASITAALDLADAFARLADDFDARPDATLSPESLSGTPAAKELRREAEDTFGALPDQFAALTAVFAGRPDDFHIPTTLTGEDAEQLQDLLDAFVSADGTATRFYLTSSSAAYSGGAFEQLKDVRVLMDEGAATFGPAATAHVGGPTAQFTDVQDTLEGDFITVGAITVLGILIVLMLLLRAVVAPLYLVATVLVSYGSTLGISGFLFQEVLGHDGVSPYLPLILFVLLVALGSDYNIFLMHRIREEHETRPMRDAVRVASGHTGAVITSAGLILAGTFGSMVTAPLTILFQMGLAVAIGVLIDTFLVRSILVPAITALVGDRAWWPSGSAFAAALGRLPVPSTGGVGAVPVGSVSTSTRASRGRLVAGIALVVLIPVTLAGLLTWSLGDGNGAGTVHAAVVNEDDGGTFTAPDGTVETLALGADLATALEAGGPDDVLTWASVDAAAAEDGLRDGRYTAVLTVPSDFSRRVAAIRGDTTGSAPKATLALATRDGSGYAVGAVASEVARAIEASAVRGVTSSYVGDTLLAVTSAQEALAAAAGDVEAVATDTSDLASAAAGTRVVAGTLVDGLQEFIDRAGEASGGTQQLVDGMRQLADGSDTLADGTAGLADGTSRAADGADRLADGATDLAGGLTQLAAETAGLPAQTAALADGAAGVAAGAAGVAAGAADLAAGLDTLATQTTGLGAQGGALDAGAAALEAGAVALGGGADQAAAGAADLASGASQLATGVDGYTGGVAALAAGCAGMGGTPALCSALDDLAAQGAPLAAAADDVAAGASGLADANAQLAAGAAGLVTGADALHDGTSQLAAGLPALEAGIGDAAAGASELAAGASELATGAGQVADGAGQLADGMPALSGGIAQLAGGGTALADGTTSYASGMDTLAGGADSLADGARQSADGAGALADGTAEAADGIDELTGVMQTAVDAGALVEAQVGSLADDGTEVADEADALAGRLATSAEGTGSYGDEARARMGELAVDPVALDTTRVRALAGPGAGLAPFLMAVAAWVAALGAFLVLPAIWRRDDGRWTRGVLVALAAAAALVVAGSVFMALAVRYLVGVEAADLLQLLAFTGLVALVCTAIVQALVALLGNRGWLVALLFLVIQVAASGVPLAATAAPGPLAFLGPLVPLTYAIDALRGAIAGAGSSPALDAVVLLVWLVASVLVTLAVAMGVERHGRPDELAAPASPSV